MELGHFCLTVDGVALGCCGSHRKKNLSPHPNSENDTEVSGQPNYLGSNSGHYFLMEHYRKVRTFFCQEDGGYGQKVIYFPVVGRLWGRSVQFHSINSSRAFDFIFQSHLRRFRGSYYLNSKCSWVISVGGIVC